MSVDVLYRGRSYAINLDNEGHVMGVGEMGLRCATATGASFETLKLLLNKRTLVPSVTPNDTLESAGTFPPSLRHQNKSLSCVQASHRPS